MLKIIRFNIWWNAIVPQVLGWIYFCALSDGLSLQDNWQHMVQFFAALVSVSAFGYLLNDFFDVESDSLSGKRNSMLRFSLAIRVVLVLLPLFMGIVSWLLLPPHIGANVLFTLQLIALILYSVPPFRFKQRGSLGVMADAFYGHINPVFITLTTFLPGYGRFTIPALGFLWLLFICTGLKGIRNILLHQLADRKKDKLAGIETFVVKKGALFTLNLVNRSLPSEIIAALLLSVFISIYYPPFFLSVLVFAVLTYLKFSGWKLADLPKRQLRFKFLYFMNDYYEGWMPVFFLILLCVHHSEFLFLLPLHLILFPSFLMKLWNDLKTIRRNFKTEDDY